MKIIDYTEMQKRVLQYINRIATFLLGMMVLTSCETAITSKFTEKSIDIQLGDSTLIYWDFQGAYGVQINGHYRIYNPIDSAYVKPKTSQRYKVTAFESDKEDLSIFWDVNVSQGRTAPLLSPISADLKGSGHRPDKVALPNEFVRPELAQLTRWAENQAPSHVALDGQGEPRLVIIGSDANTHKVFTPPQISPNFPQDAGKHYNDSADLQQTQALIALKFCAWNYETQSNINNIEFSKNNFILNLKEENSDSKVCTPTQISPLSADPKSDVGKHYNNMRGLEAKIVNIEEFTQNAATNNNICICLDNSAAAINNVEILDIIENSSQDFANDNYFLSYFNQNFGGVYKVCTPTQISPLSAGPKSDARKDYNNLRGGPSSFKNIPAQSGFAAINKSVGQAINYLVNSGASGAALPDNNVIIIITSSADNASVIYDENDLIEHAKNNNIPVFVIAIGNSTPTYNLTLLASHTGGRLFRVEDNNINKIKTYLNLIINSIHNHYKMNIEITRQQPDIHTNTGKSAPNMFISAGLNRAYLGEGTPLLADTVTAPQAFDTYLYPFKKSKMYSEFQALAYYDRNSVNLAEVFEPAIQNLVEVLKDNPNLIVELIGNAGGDEGTDQQCLILARRRARIVRQMMIENGVKPEQIRASAEGSARPIYLFPKLDWQYKYNNRLEVRWLLPEDYPYEIAAETYLTETQALESVEKWETKTLGNVNLKAYYQRILQNNRPAYRVIIWGYETETDASRAAKALSKIYNKVFTLTR